MGPQGYISERRRSRRWKVEGGRGIGESRNNAGGGSAAGGPKRREVFVADEALCAFSGIVRVLCPSDWLGGQFDASSFTL